MSQKVIKLNHKHVNPKYSIPKTTDKKKEYNKGFRKRKTEELTIALRSILNSDALIKDVVSAMFKNEVMLSMSTEYLVDLARKNYK